MKMLRLLLFLAVAITASRAQTPDGSTASPTTPASSDPEATLRYIHAGWDTLTRSTTDCHSLVDIKVAANPVLYLPAGFITPPEAAAVAEKCHVKIATLPRRIEKIADVQPSELPAAGLLYLPNPYVVPGGRFNEMYGWDSYFIVLGLEADHREALAKGMVDNFFRILALVIRRTGEAGHKRALPILGSTIDAAAAAELRQRTRNGT